jgi:hypothetical protein
MEQGNSCRNAKGKYKWRTHKANTKDLYGGGSNRSSDEASVMGVERRVRPNRF